MGVLVLEGVCGCTNYGEHNVIRDGICVYSSSSPGKRVSKVAPSGQGQQVQRQLWLGKVQHSNMVFGQLHQHQQRLRYSLVAKASVSAAMQPAARARAAGALLLSFPPQGGVAAKGIIPNTELCQCGALGLTQVKCFIHFSTWPSLVLMLHWDAAAS